MIKTIFSALKHCDLVTAALIGLHIFLFTASSSPAHLQSGVHGVTWTCHVAAQDSERSLSKGDFQQKEETSADKRECLDLDLEGEEDLDEGDSFFDDPLPKPQKTYGWWAWLTFDLWVSVNSWVKRISFQLQTTVVILPLTFTLPSKIKGKFPESICWIQKRKIILWFLLWNKLFQ